MFSFIFSSVNRVKDLVCNSINQVLEKIGLRETVFDVTDYVLFTERDPHSWGFYKRQEASDWSANEFEFVKEAQEYEDAPDNIKKLFFFHKSISSFDLYLSKSFAYRKLK